jgi:hypothetical protein
MKYLLLIIALAATVLAGFAVGKAQPKADVSYYEALSLNGGANDQCQDYVIGEVASGQEIAAMLNEASKGAAQYGCVNLMVEGAE